MGGGLCFEKEINVNVEIVLYIIYYNNVNVKIIIG
tara:strand:- start:2164 stop:2268 length:105 start_codon:yes stop_codon:yes gene_type:complete